MLGRGEGVKRVHGGPRRIFRWLEGQHQRRRGVWGVVHELKRAGCVRLGCDGKEGDWEVTPRERVHIAGL